MLDVDAPACLPFQCVAHRQQTVIVQVVYIDGSHLPQDVLTDAAMAWKLLKKDGILIFDGWCMTASTR